MSQKKIRLAVDLTVEPNAAGPNDAGLETLKQRLLALVPAARDAGTLTADTPTEIVDCNAVCVEYG